MPVKLRITLLFTLLVMAILLLVCGSVYYFSYTNRIEDVRTRLYNRAITTGRLLDQLGTSDSAMMGRIDAATTLAIVDKVIMAYDSLDHLVYRYSDNRNQLVTLDRTQIDRVRRTRTDLYFTQNGRDVVACWYGTGQRPLVIIAGGSDETGREKLAQLREVLILSFVGGILISILGGYFFSTGLLVPLRRISDEVKVISARNLTRRIRASSARQKDEWDYLTDTLNQLLDRLQESFEIQGRFIANASHELSTPLTSISNQLEVALQRVRNLEEYRHVIQSVLQDVHQMNKLTQTLLEFARASGTAGGLQLDLIRIDEILLRLPGEIPKMGKGFIVTLDFEGLPAEEEGLLVFGNEELLFTAIRNIVSNACKYSDDHHAMVQLFVADRQIFVRIIDKGKGIAREEWERIFQPFYRTADGSAAGFGLGLSLARRIVKLHKGWIDIDSSPGQGSVFLVRLPAAGQSVGPIS